MIELFNPGVWAAPLQFGALTYGAGASGQLHTSNIIDMTAAAGALPINQQYSGQTLPTIGGRIVGFEVHQHFNVPGINVNFHLALNGVVLPAFDLILLAAAWRVAVWPATPIVYAPGALNVLNVTFDMAAPIAGNTRPTATAWVTAR